MGIAMGIALRIGIVGVVAKIVKMSTPRNAGATLLSAAALTIWALFGKGGK